MVGELAGWDSLIESSFGCIGCGRSLVFVFLLSSFFFAASLEAGVCPLSNLMTTVIALEDEVRTPVRE